MMSYRNRTWMFIEGILPLRYKLEEMNKKTKDDKSISLLSSFVYVRGVLRRNEMLALDLIIYLRTSIHMYFLMLTAIFEAVEEHKTIEYLSLIRNH